MNNYRNKRFNDRMLIAMDMIEYIKERHTIAETAEHFNCSQKKVRKDIKDLSMSSYYYGQFYLSASINEAQKILRVLARENISKANKQKKE